MKQVAFWVFIAGVIVAACYAAKLAPVEPSTGAPPSTPGDLLSAWWDTAGGPFSIGVVLMVGGGLLGRHIEKLENAPDESGSEAASSPSSIMDAIGSALEELPSGGLADAVEESRQGLERVLEDLVPQFLVHRPKMIAEMGLERFAEMIGQFASAERNTARAWSALTDGVPVEAEASLDRAKKALANARAALSA